MMINKYPEALKHEHHFHYLPIHIECSCQCRATIIEKCIELYPEGLDDQVFLIIVRSLSVKLSLSSFHAYSPTLSIVLTLRPMCLYNDHDIRFYNAVRVSPYCRRKILSLLPRLIFTPRHDTDYRDLNWKYRGVITMLLSQIRRQNKRLKVTLVERIRLMLVQAQALSKQDENLGKIW
jgi:hypothetical protein